MGFVGQFEHSQSLFDAAIDEFVANGYDGASINTILRSAGMSKGQFYYHFENKQALYFALIEEMIARKRAFLAEAMQPSHFAGDIFDILRVQITYGMDFARAHPAIFRFSESFIREQGNPIYRAALARFNFDDNAAIDQLVEAARQRGDFRDDFPPAFIRHLIGYLLTNAVEVANLSTQDSFEPRLEYLIEFIRSGIQRRS